MINMIQISMDDASIGKMIICRATKKDFKELARLCQNVKEIEDFAGQEYDDRYLGYYLTKDKELLVAKIGKKMVGALNAEYEKMAGYTFFVNIIVKKSHRRKGIGRALMRELEKRTREKRIPRIMGFVYDWNKKMHKIMLHYDYKPTSKTTLYSKRL